MSETKKFKTESKRLLDLMTNSIYANKEIFLRELLSNASDAIDKYHYLSLNDSKLSKDKDYYIRLIPNKAQRTLTIEDNGIGMSHDELINNLGTIASSGSLEFLKNLSDEELKKGGDIDIIGQFGVGFYSAFMVAKKVEVETKSPFDESGYIFSSVGTETYKIDTIEKSENGSRITLYLKDNTEEENYDVYLDQYELQDLVKRYSDYIRYPIKMEMTHTSPEFDKDGKAIEGSSKEEVVDETLNSMIPLWKKNKSEVTQEELNSFYKSKFNDYEEPLLSLFINVEGLFTYSSLVFIPSHPPYDLYSDKYQKGLQLYSKGVFIQDKCDDLVPEYLRFIKGLVDSSDLSLNISREILQQNAQLKKIAANIEKKILNELEKMKNDDFEKYSKFFELYGINFKYGLYDNFGEKKNLLKDLVLYHSIEKENYITLKQYKDGVKTGQEFIYYASGKTKAEVQALPQMDLLKKQGYDVLVLSDDIDEFAIMVLGEYDGMKFKSITSGDLNLISKEEQDKIDELKKDKEPLLAKLKELLKDDVNDVVLSKRLVDSPVCLVSGEGLSFEMEKVISKMPTDNSVKAERILEINPNHELFKAIEKVYDENPDTLSQYAYLLFSQAQLIEGLPIKNPVEFSNQMCNLMIKSITKNEKTID